MTHIRPRSSKLTCVGCATSGSCSNSSTTRSLSGFRFFNASSGETNFPRNGSLACITLVAGLLLFGIPLFVGLGRTDLENDEAIYSYSVERMVALHDWLTPRAIYDGADNPFLEKPPRKTVNLVSSVLSHFHRSFY